MINPPNKLTNAGLEFNYVVWSPGSIVQLTKVPWQSDYGDVVYFRTDQELHDYLAKDHHAISLERVSYCRPGEPVIVPVPFNVANQYNYVRVHNPAQPISGDQPADYYYFIEGVEYLSPGATQLFLQLDVWQTYSRRMQISSGYVVQGHYGIWLDNQDKKFNGSRYADVDEGHDLGAELGTAFQQRFNIRDDGSVAKTSLVMYSNTSLLEYPGNANDPRLEPANGTTIHFSEARNTGSFRLSCDVVLFQDSNFYSELQQRILKNRPWVAQGIFALFMVPGLRGNDKNAIWGVSYNSACTPTSAIYDVEMTLTDDVRHLISTCYPTHVHQYKKLFTYPYTALELSTHTGNPIILKPQLLHTPELRVRADVNIMLPTPNVCVYPLDYNRKPFGVSQHYGPGKLAGDGVDMLTGYFNLPQLPLVHDSYGLYMASNKNSIAYQHRTNDWAQTKALAASEAAYNMQTQAMDSMSQTTAINNQIAGMHNSVNNTGITNRAWVGAGGQLLSGALSGNAMGVIGGAVGAATTAVNAGIDIAQNNANLAVSQYGNNLHLKNSLASAKYARDVNKQLADFSARGDYQNAIAGINAKIQDMDLVPPTVTGQLAGDMSNIARQDGFGLWLKIKVPNAGKLLRIVWQWARYGYHTHESISHFRYMLYMSHVTYWKMLDVKFAYADMPEQFRRTIKGMFERGISLWHNPEHMTHFNWEDNILLSDTERVDLNGEIAGGIS